MTQTLTRRGFLSATATVLGASAGAVLAEARPFALGLTPVFLSNDTDLLRNFQNYLQSSMQGPVEFVQRRTYEEITGMLLEGSLDAAWVCGYPYVQHEDAFALVAVPVWQYQPLYRSYLIAAKDSGAQGLTDLRGTLHAFSDPNSNSGFLVTASDLAALDERPESFFRRTIFTYGHRNVVRAIAVGLAESGSVDGYVWEALTVVEPELTDQTRIVQRSELLGFPPVVCRIDRAETPSIRALQAALVNMPSTATGMNALTLLQLDGFTPGSSALFDGIAARMRRLNARG
ncbi:MAG: PhnD/SsuA/transferrin family substrate-binding protein [Rhodobacteraceae bacterium]|nr:PhnD/SsuA/transferrin family substrate-binding protein [Paracoccaceae bacterium]